MGWDDADMRATAWRITSWMRGRWGVLFDGDDALHEGILALCRQRPGEDWPASYVVRSVWHASRYLLRREESQARRHPGAAGLSLDTGHSWMRAPNDPAREAVARDELARALAYLATDPDGDLLLALALGYAPRELTAHPGLVGERATLARARLAAHLGDGPRVRAAEHDRGRASVTRGWRESAKDRARERNTRRVA